jgi:hypothetical protein
VTNFSVREKNCTLVAHYRILSPSNGRPLLVVADIHCDYDALDAALRVPPNDALIVFLGDLIDRGPYSPFCAVLVTR